MRWHLSHRADKRALPIADRHYNRQKVGSPQFVPPGRCCVLLTNEPNALWVTSWPFAEYVKHDWPGAWMCSCFRNESPDLASELIREAIAATRSFFGEPPDLGMVTFIDPREVKPTMVRGYPVWGWTYHKAGFHFAGVTKGGLIAWQTLRDEMPCPDPPLEAFDAAKEKQLEFTFEEAER